MASAKQYILNKDDIIRLYGPDPEPDISPLLTPIDNSTLFD